MVGMTIAAIIGVVVVAPVVIILAARVLRPMVKISHDVDEIGKDGVALTGDLDPVPALLDTQRLVQELTGNAVAYLTALDPLI